MLRAEFERDLMATAGRTLLILWVGMVGTPLVLNLVAVLAPVEGIFAGAAPPSLVMDILYGLAVAAGLASILLRSLLLVPERLVAGSPTAGSVAMGTGGSTAGDPAEQRAIGLLARFISRLLPGWALADTVAVLGFAATVLTGEAVHVRWLGGLALALLLLVHRPSTGPLQEALELLKRGA